jgi:hypothetical protein
VSKAGRISILVVSIGGLRVGMLTDTVRQGKDMDGVAPISSAFARASMSDHALCGGCASTMQE